MEFEHTEFQKAINDVYKYSPILGLEEQPVLQKWIKRITSDKTSRVATDYAQYLAFQLRNSVFQYPFSAPPPEGPLSDLKELLFGAEESPWQSEILDKTRNDSFGQCAIMNSVIDAGCEVPYSRSPIFDPCSEVDGSGEHTVLLAELEDLPVDAPLWILLSRVSPHTSDCGALLQTVVAEELAEWTARLAADQTAAEKFLERTRKYQEEDTDELEWRYRARRRTDYWSELWNAWKGLRIEDKVAGDVLLSEMIKYINGQNRQLKVEQLKLKAYSDELNIIKKQYRQNQTWNQTKVEIHTFALNAEILKLKEQIENNARKIEALQEKQ